MNIDSLNRIISSQKPSRTPPAVSILHPLLAIVVALGLSILSSWSAPSPLQFAQQAYLKASNAGGPSAFPDSVGDRFGVSVAVSGDTVVVGAPLEDSDATGVNGNQTNNSTLGAGAAYVFVRSRGVWFQQAYLKASNTGEQHQFGWSVSVSGDRLVVGAIFADQTGAAYVFARQGTNWSQEAVLKASNADPFDGFGAAVAITGDTVVVGAPSEASNTTGVNGDQNDNSLQRPGAAYVFVRSGTNWIQQAYLKASNTGMYDEFGYSIAADADTVVVGANSESSNATGVNGNQASNITPGAGAAYVFVRSGTNWTQQAYLKASNTGADDYFGRSVSISGDTVVVGANQEDSNATGVNGNSSINTAPESGAAYVFLRSGTNWAQQAYLKASNAGSSDQFGFTVAISGDALAIGAPGENSNATGVNGNQNNNNAEVSGATYLFVRSGTNWAQQAYCKASNAEVGDQFGWSAALSGNTVIVGAQGESSRAREVYGDETDNSAFQSGASYVFDLAATNAPEIALEQPAGVDLTNGMVTVDFGALFRRGDVTQRTFTIRNLGDAPITFLRARITGAHSNEFVITGITAAPVFPAESTTLTVSFTPLTGGIKSAVLQVISNDTDESPFDIALTGKGEVNLGGNPLQLDFDSPLALGLNSYGVTSIGSGGMGGSGVLKLMTNVVFSLGDFVIDDFSGGAEVTAFKASFDLLLGGGTFPPGDGFSFNFATNFNLSQPTPREEGFTNGLSVSFDTWDNVSEFFTLYGTNDTAPAIETKTFLRQNGFQSMAGIRNTSNGLPAGPLLTNAATGQPLSLETEPPLLTLRTLTNFVPVTIELKEDSTLWVTYNGFLVLSNVQTYMPGVAGGKFALAARTGAAMENVWIDNLSIQTFTNARPLVFATADPLNQRLDPGRPATFQAQLFGTPPIAMQWYSNEVAIIGATNASYTTPPATLANHGDVYRIEASNATGVTNRSATLILQPVIFLSNGPTNTVLRPNQSAVFQADLAGSLPIQLQWFSNDVAIVGATNAAYTTQPATLANDGDLYRIEATNAAGSISRSATLIIAKPPTIVQSPTNQTVVAGDNVTFTVTVTNNATLPIGFQWRKISTVLTNIVLNSRTCSFTVFNVPSISTPTNGPGNYRVVITNAANLSPPANALATLTVLPATAPTATTLTANNVSSSSAALNASINPMGAQTVAWFDYGLTADYGSRTRATNVGNASDVVAFSQAVTGLLSGTNYHYRVVATNYGGIALGADLVFEAPASISPPTISAYELLGNGQFRLRFDSTPGTTYSVLVSTNLVDWTALGAATELTPGHFEFNDTAAPGHPTRFYRLRTP